MAVDKIENTYRGRCAQNGMKTWKVNPNEYIVGAMFAVTLKLSNTVKNFPKPFVGARIVEKRSPIDSSTYASDHAGTRGMAAAKAAPMHWHETLITVMKCE